MPPAHFLERHSILRHGTLNLDNRHGVTGGIVPLRHFHVHFFQQTPASPHGNAKPLPRGDALSRGRAGHRLCQALAVRSGTAITIYAVIRGVGSPRRTGDAITPPARRQKKAFRAYRGRGSSVKQRHGRAPGTGPGVDGWSRRSGGLRQSHRPGRPRFVKIPVVHTSCRLRGCSIRPPSPSITRLYPSIKVDKPLDEVTTATTLLHPATTALAPRGDASPCRA